MVSTIAVAYNSFEKGWKAGSLITVMVLLSGAKTLMAERKNNTVSKYRLNWKNIPEDVLSEVNTDIFVGRFLLSK
jgi:hypothetical protein